eukprot:scaffold2201_cov119-Cylindrotheca_fusiformis.AAC.8
MIPPTRRLEARCFSLFFSRMRQNQLVSTHPQNSFRSQSSSSFEPCNCLKREFQPPLKTEVRQFSKSAIPIKKKGRRKYVPRKAAVELTEKARNFFHKLLEKNPNYTGVMLNYKQASSGQPRMVFSFDFITEDELSTNDEGVSLEVNDDGSPKSPEEALKDGRPKLYVNGDAFLKVLGATVDVDLDTATPVLYDREGNRMDPNA